MAETPAPWPVEPQRPWPKPQVTPELVHCPRCLGALPPDIPSACSTCGSGAAPGREDGAPIYPQQVERARLAAGGTTVTWAPQVADPEHPTIAELDLTCFLAGEPLLVEGFEETITSLAMDVRMHGETPERAHQRNQAAQQPQSPPAPPRPWWQRFARRPNVG